MKKQITLQQSLDHVEKVNKWLLLSPLQRLDIIKRVEQSKGRVYKTESAMLAACLKYV